MLYNSSDIAHSKPCCTIMNKCKCKTTERKKNGAKEEKKQQNFGNTHTCQSKCEHELSVCREIFAVVFFCRHTIDK